jgi:hypothetical protein
LIRLLAAAALAAAALAPQAEARETGFVQFHTPSGNIHCGFASFAGEPDFLRCDIFSGFKPLPHRPASCDLDWGTAVGIGRTGRARLLCVGDTVANPKGRVLGYGQTWRGRGFACVSRASGLTCRSPSGRGFFLSRERSRLL